MKKFSIAILALFLTFSCNTADDVLPADSTLPAQDIFNLSYGTDAEQIMDIYLPAGRTSSTKTIVLVHGGGWTSGSKADFNYFIPTLKSEFPDHAIVNINYRLATLSSPGYPKQIDDIQQVVAHLKSANYHISDDYAFIGASAGAHLSMLYAYNFDTTNDVKAVCSIVGPTDFTDPAYTGNPLFQNGLTYLVGNYTWESNPEVFIEVSPATHVSAQSPPTIMFYGGQDPLIPASQSPRLKEKLDDFGIYNELYLYPNGGHGNWDAVTMLDFTTKLTAFLHAQL